MWLVLMTVIRLLEELSSSIASRASTDRILRECKPSGTMNHLLFVVEQQIEILSKQSKQNPPAALTAQSLDEITSNTKRMVKTEGENTPNNPNDIPAPKKIM
ncbi:hypothetical protein G6F46_000765 [Rhizopus delemar]|uniref:Uncharacterized protein n=2 Tax=Rhizopus TaxID=4842 RepID=A0A9P6Z4P2_9FUNG|nr:hypothetical protein G6F55_002048 [Rhizopus delemar]KAG1550790.1 hypothetical protein G6F51_002238 [Rhizopus arrhizus]KAG1498627.1 hypothetical protein G6F54_004955 [Rhizopus delemar]KAG1516975.1 hypothetical protein G6F53_001746 [Rhizopus delemar]KAG1521349.1 hypothetical protein G6F52_006824 [Rhizopus delemar]